MNSTVLVLAANQYMFEDGATKQMVKGTKLYVVDPNAPCDREGEAGYKPVQVSGAYGLMDKLGPIPCMAQLGFGMRPDPKTQRPVLQLLDAVSMGPVSIHDLKPLGGK